jgi:hydroxymethylbilane synthase
MPTSSSVLRIGTRRSKLALAQSGMMQRAIARALGVEAERVELVEIVTTGDRVQDRRLLEIGGKALFTKEIEEALLDGRVDLAIHSMKDVPAEQPEGLDILAVPLREDAADAFISRDFAAFADLPTGARLGTASLRRQAQALALRPDLKIEMLRGNVDTRLRRLQEGDFEAILLAASGLNRLGLSEVIRERLSLDDFLPAPGQGALAIQGRAADRERHADWIAALNHRPTETAVAAERGAMVALEGSCRTAVGAHARIDGDVLTLTTEILAPDGSARWRRTGALTGAGADEAGAGDVKTSARLLGERLGAEIHTASGDQMITDAELSA